MPSKIYLDNNASTFLDPTVSEFLVHTIKTLQGNPSSSHSVGQQVRNALAKARSSIAMFFHVKPSEVVFTSCATESMNMLIRGILQQRAPRGGHVITSSAEHSCVYMTLKQLEQQGHQVSFLSPGLYGAVSPQAVRDAIRPDTQLITLMAVNNETGVKTDIEAIAEIALEHGIPFVVDGVAALGKEVLTIPEGVSAMAFSGHKIHAPQGVGLAIIRSGTKIVPFLTGGKQEMERRAGTENVFGILAMAKAIEELERTLPSAVKTMEELRDLFEATLLQAIPEIGINGEGERVCNVSNLAFPQIDGESLLIALDQAGVAASHGAACSSGGLEPSRVLLAMGIPSAQAHSSLRFSLSRFTTQQEIEQACEIILNCVQRLGAIA